MSRKKYFLGKEFQLRMQKTYSMFQMKILKELAKCANEITRDYNGNKVDVEQLNNIKKKCM